MQMQAGALGPCAWRTQPTPKCFRVASMHPCMDAHALDMLCKAWSQPLSRGSTIWHQLEDRVTRMRRSGAGVVCCGAVAPGRGPACPPERVVP